MRKEYYFFDYSKTSVAFLHDHYTLRQGLEKMKFHGFIAMPVITKGGSL